MSIAVATSERDAHESITAPDSLAVSSSGKKKGFFSTLTSYLTSTHKSDPKPVVQQKKKLMNSWDDVDLVRLNTLVCNILYDANSYEPLISEIERVAGRRREHCFYGLVSVLFCLVLLHDAIGAITAFMTLLVPTSLIAVAISSPSSYENPSYLKDHHDFFVRYWTVYAVFVASESFLSSLIQWDLRLFRLVFMTACLSSRIPVLSTAHAKVLGFVTAIRELIDKNNYEKTASKQKSN
ncbi:unnamed protein product [Caenorhabditis sp. 36 PRJEB53466]|nr:unnamed protein product [Caenorhabditis sp. 36 PRJEB53466]